MDILHDEINATSPLFSILQNCLELLNRDWICSLSHVYREANRAADGLTSLGHTLNLGTTFFSSPHSCVLPLIEDDIEGLCFNRTLCL
ncbi:hypothetical protein ACOSQ2_028165 [Xanthoceras sorbifolium]